VEVFGRADPACDAELLVMIDDLRRDLALEFRFEINSLGCAKCRPAFRAALLEYGKAHFNELCSDCHERLERNPLRLLDCKIDIKLAEQAPKSLDFLCPECRKHFDTVMDLLGAAGVRFLVNPRIVRGLDYYMRTTFEVTSTNLGAQNAVVAGGRYDGLVEMLGGAPVPGIGFAIGMERIALALEAVQTARAGLPRVALIALGEAAARRATELARELRALPIQVELLSTERSLKSQLKRADRIGANYAVIIGQDELGREAAQLRNLGASSQREVSLKDLVAELYPPPQE
jgi:histidyl-tRNA synthetase